MRPPEHFALAPGRELFHRQDAATAWAFLLPGGHRLESGDVLGRQMMVTAGVGQRIVNTSAVVAKVPTLDGAVNMRVPTAGTGAQRAADRTADEIGGIRGANDGTLGGHACLSPESKCAGPGRR